MLRLGVAQRSMRMWVAVTFAAIGLTGAAFMVWFLLALLCFARVPYRPATGLRR